MNLTPLFVLSLGLSLGFTFAEEAGYGTYTGLYVANGLTVTETENKDVQISGWYDAEKTEAEDVDELMCYAASASNLLAWWQNSAFKVDSDAPMELDAIWGAYKENNQDAGIGGSTLSAINWWISGVYAPSSEVINQDDNSSVWEWSSDSSMWDRYYTTQSEIEAMFGQNTVLPVTLPNYKKDGADFSGYYYDQYGLTQEKLSDFLVTAWIYTGPITPDEPEVDDETSGTVHHTMTLGDVEIAEDEGPESIYDIDFVEILDASAVSLSIYSDTTSLAHAITLWGVEYDADGKLTTLWLTDSDDYTEKLFSLSVTLDEKENKIYLGKWGDITKEVTDEDGQKVTVTKKGYYDNTYGENVFIGVIFALDTSEIANWQLVPEPATTTLSLMALAALAARRCRRR